LRHCFEKCGELPVATGYHNLRAARMGSLIPQLRCSDYRAAGIKKPVKSVIKAETMRAGSSHFGSGSKHKVMHLYACLHSGSIRIAWNAPQAAKS
jgi:hypothetical protein